MSYYCKRELRDIVTRDRDVWKIRLETETSVSRPRRRDRDYNSDSHSPAFKILVALRKQESCAIASWPRNASSLSLRVSWKFSGLPDYAHGYFSQNFMGFRWYSSLGRPYILFLSQHSFARNFRLQFRMVVANIANPQFWGRGGRRGSGMVLFERAFVSFYRPSIVTFPLSLRVSEILPLLFSSMPLFPTPPLVSSKFPHVPLGIGRSLFGCKERRCWANCPCS